MTDAELAAFWRGVILGMYFELTDGQLPSDAEIDVTGLTRMETSAQFDGAHYVAVGMTRAIES